MQKQDQIQQSAAPSQEYFPSQQPYQQQIAKFADIQYEDKDFNQMLQLIESDEQIHIIHGLIGINKIFKKNIDILEEPQINIKCANILIKKCINFIKHKLNIVIEQSSCILIDLTLDSKFCQIIGDQGLIQLLIKLISQNKNYNNNILKNFLMILSNMAADCSKSSNFILTQGIEVIMEITKNNSNQKILQQKIFLFCNIIRRASLNKNKFIPQIFSFLVKELLSNKFILNSQRAVQSILWALSKLTEQQQLSYKDETNQTELIQKLLLYANNNILQISTPALRVLGNFAMGSQKQTQKVIDNGFFHLAHILLTSPKKFIKREVCWTLSNIAGGTQQQRNALLQETTLLEQLGNILSSAENDLKKQVCWIFINLLDSKEKQGDVLKLCMNYSLFDVLLQLLNDKSPQIITEGLQCLYKLLYYWQKSCKDNKNFLISQLKDGTGLNRIKELQNNQERGVSQNVKKMLKRFFA